MPQQRLRLISQLHLTLGWLNPSSHHIYEFLCSLQLCSAMRTQKLTGFQYIILEMSLAAVPFLDCGQRCW